MKSHAKRQNLITDPAKANILSKESAADERSPLYHDWLLKVACLEWNGHSQKKTSSKSQEKKVDDRTGTWLRTNLIDREPQVSIPSFFKVSSKNWATVRRWSRQTKNPGRQKIQAGKKSRQTKSRHQHFFPIAIVSLRSVRKGSQLKWFHASRLT